MAEERPTPRLVPVLDVMNGAVVRAVGGDRDRYRPVVSALTAATDPPAVAAALLAAAGSDELYVADLDAIRWAHPDPAVDDLLDRTPAAVFLDQGGLSRKPLPANCREILSLEARLPPESYRRHARTPGAVFSVELRGGRLVDGWQDWGQPSASGSLGLIRRAFDLGYRAFVVLDLARVGTGGGAGTEDLLRAARDEFPGVELIAGGGVRGWADVARLGDTGADAVLVASALHDGTLRVPRHV